MDSTSFEVGITTSRALAILVNAPAILEKELPVDEEMNVLGTPVEVVAVATGAAKEETNDNSEAEVTMATVPSPQDETVSMELISPEEHAAVRKSSRHISIKDLLQLTIMSLLEENSFISMPVSCTAKRVMPDGTETEWVQWYALVHPTRIEHVYARIERVGIGSVAGNITILPIELCRAAHYTQSMDVEDDQDGANGKSLKEQQKQSQADTKDNNVDANGKNQDDPNGEWMNFTTRMRNHQVRELITEQAVLSFDFLALLSVGSIIAGVGLITNNSVFIVASMLVSPMMGPVLGLAFGTRIMDWPLASLSLRNEILSVLGCMFWGAVIGFAAGFTPFAQNTWPTFEMDTRGYVSSLLTGIAIAIPSGAGVCLSVLGDNVSCLVGVAISASLLPPAVNTGICFVYAILLSAGLVGENNLGRTGSDFAIMGAISFSLTALNIVCIWGAGVLMFWVKDVARYEQKKAFWAHEVKAREGKVESESESDLIPTSTNRMSESGKEARRGKGENDKTDSPRQKRDSTLFAPLQMLPDSSHYHSVEKKTTDGSDAAHLENVRKDFQEFRRRSCVKF